MTHLKILELKIKRRTLILIVVGVFIKLDVEVGQSEKEHLVLYNIYFSFDGGTSSVCSIASFIYPPFQYIMTSSALPRLRHWDMILTQDMQCLLKINVVCLLFPIFWNVIVYCRGLKLTDRPLKRIRTRGESLLRYLENFFKQLNKSTFSKTTQPILFKFSIYHSKRYVTWMFL